MGTLEGADAGGLAKAAASRCGLDVLGLRLRDFGESGGFGI